jgi:hypothetical protein
MNCQNPCGMSHRTCKQVLLLVGFEFVERFNPFDIFCCSPHLQPAEGGDSVKGEKRNS